MFRVEYSAYLGSNEGSFIAIARQVATHFGDLRWWPLWDCGMPFQNTYLPLLHLFTGAFARLSGHSAALAFHQVSAAFFAIGPVCLYLMAWHLTQQPGTSFLAALAYSLVSPCAWLFPLIRLDMGSAWNLRRLNILAFYGEGPYTAAVAFLPLAILFLYLAITQRRLWHKLLAGVFLGATVLSNAFGAVLLVLAAVSLLAVIDARRFWRNVWLLLVIGTLAYAAISPLLPPSVVQAIRTNSPTVEGDYRFTLRSLGGVAEMAAGFWIIWWITRKAVSPALRFFLLFAFLITSIVALGAIRIYVVPQPYRYQIAMDMALCTAAVFSVATFLRSRVPRLAVIVALVGLLAAIVQFVNDRHYAHHLILATDITTSAPYRVAGWLDQHMHGQRVMVGGSYSFYFNDFTDTPQLHGGHDPMIPNSTMAIAIFTIYSGLNAGARDGQVSILWLKALGARAVSVPGPHSAEYYKPFANPAKFEGLLPVLWRQNDDTIYAIPVRSNSLAHIV
ncbi:MAG TPA: glycosyltransferase family 39 protein, partial [Bryobacteraceae bacterium]|nr:glycosyltransferase family 39 protein [Bryobacteraceae bacterium]